MSGKGLYWNVEDGRGYLLFESSPDPCVDESRLAVSAEFGIKGIVCALDQDVESGNVHEYCGLYQVMVILVTSMFGEVECLWCLLRVLW